MATPISSTQNALSYNTTSKTAVQIKPILYIIFNHQRANRDILPISRMRIFRGKIKYSHLVVLVSCLVHECVMPKEGMNEKLHMIERDLNEFMFMTP